MLSQGHVLSPELNRCRKCGSDDIRLYWITVDGTPSIPSAECEACDFGIEGLGSYHSDDDLIKAITTAWNERNPMSYPELTPEEKATRARIAELRSLIKGWAAWRRRIKLVWGMKHGSTEFLDELAKLRAGLAVSTDPGFAKYEKWWGNQPYRTCYRYLLHGLHLEYGELRGKPHVLPSKSVPDEKVLAISNG